MHPTSSFHEKNPRGHSLPLGTHLHHCSGGAQMFHCCGNSCSSSTQGKCRHCWATGSHSLHFLQQHLVLDSKTPKSMQKDIMCSLQGYLFGEPCPSSGGKAVSLCFHPAHLNHRHSPSCLGSFSRSQDPKMERSEGFAHLTPWKDQMREPCRSPAHHPAKIIYRSLQRKDQSFSVLSETTQPCWQ